MREIQIAGGGLAGLTLGLLLRQKGVPVTVREAASYPRHRVCGEFLSGRGQTILESLAPEITLTATLNRSTAWYAGDRFLCARALPRPAFGLSRFALDAALARLLTEAGGAVQTGIRVKDTEGAGLVRAAGRERGAGDLIGLKLHAYDLPLSHDLCLYLGSGGYVGAARIEGGKVNICGLFRIRKEISPGRERMLENYLRANGIHALAEAVAASTVDPASISATTAGDFSHRHFSPGEVRLGDAYTSIPPFAGNGMSMAIESAALAGPILTRYAEGEIDWETARRESFRQLRRHFRARLSAARLLHPLLLRSAGRRPLEEAMIFRLFPFQLFFRLLR